MDSEYSGDGTGSTEYEVIQQAASNAHSSLQLIKSESSGAASNASNNANQSNCSNATNSTAILCKALSQEHSAQTKASELRAYALILALHAELRGLKIAFADRHRLIQSYKVTQIVIDLKRAKLL